MGRMEFNQIDEGGGFAVGEEKIDRYYDWRENRALDPERDGCCYEEWESSFERYPLAVHPGGFRVLQT